MATKTARVRLEGNALRFVVETGSGHHFVLDDEAGNSGPRPAELVPAAAAACAAFDVLSILRKKQQDVRYYQVEAIGVQAEDAHPAVFTRLDVTHQITGPGLRISAVRRAIELSATRYCSVGGTLSSGVTEIHHHYLVRDEAGGERRGEVLITGPYAKLEVLGENAAATEA